MNHTVLKLYNLLTKRQKKGVLALIFLVLIGMVLEIIGLSTIIPVMNLIVDGNIKKYDFVYQNLPKIVLELSDKEIVFVFLSTIIIFNFLRIFFQAYLILVQNNFLSNVTAVISNDLFKLYINQKYKFHITRNATELIKNIQVEVSLTSSVLSSIISLLTEVSFFLAITGTLIYIQPVVALALILLISVSIFIYYSFTKAKISSDSVKRESIDKSISKLVIESLTGIKDIIISRNSENFYNYYRKFSFERARVNSRQGIINQLPRYYFEFIAIVAIVGLAFILNFQGENNTSLIAILSIFAASIFKILPIINKIVSSVQNIKMNKPSIDLICNEFELYTQYHENQISKYPFVFNELQMKDVSFKYQNSKTFVVNNFNLKIKRGDFIGIVGVSGSGKTTLIDLILGLHQPTSGRIILNNEETSEKKCLYRFNVGYVSQNVYLLNDSIKNNIALGESSTEINEERIKLATYMAELDSFIKYSNEGLQTLVGENGIKISGGQKQRIGIARSLYSDAEILFLDEATSSLDDSTEREILNTILKLKRKKTIIMISHKRETLVDCDFILEVKNGKLLKDMTNEI
ncbi:ABC transporter ATP-binding protein/permease [Flavobacteriaceae bacterium]|nr:ABC transporter ATP-binding protein/permease [Flavobacteriaceae bacterium]MDB2695238.1 ABC transporter ATP-binding protein/permease [Flavobacteriaceae bacterium]MDC6478607.1 ABC transporter ATP-binding protein [Flavobacteriaceae bacterium]